MAYTVNDIKEKAKSLLGDSLRPGGEEMLGAVCEAAAMEIKSKLRGGVSEESIGETYVTAAGILAIAIYMELSDSAESGINSFSAGNLSVRLSGTEGIKASAASLRKTAEGMLSAYLKDSGFCFMGVDG